MRYEHLNERKSPSSAPYNPPSSSSLPTHYPCHTGPGPTWHSLVDLIELDIPACLGIVWWHENLPAVSMKAEEKRGIGNTSSERSESRGSSGMEGLLRNEGPAVRYCAPAQCRVGLGQGCHFIYPRDVANSWHLTHS
ncbi:hypothetical protein CgunFtcFv8_000492 [Champsocephalus gunnari]|uniref:Uncharacterized protein n=2 Tax=Champsocephalus gunnari TaxID=52237 RepID=A0AAN8DI92_CHAGU|nr:hypothetical protein CgunFtcFv8_000492 [Champsocephalus gunnari]